MRCTVCRERLSIARLAEVREENESGHALGREIRLRGYEVLGLLGQGGMGLVFSVLRERDHALLALKMLPPDCLRYPELIARFEQEARLMAALSHPSIIAIHDMGRWKNHPYLVMDFVPGVSLREHIDRRAPVPLGEALTIATGVAEGIQACHDAGLVHRDLKPGNVLLSQTGAVIVTDFGIANLIQRLGEQTDYGVAIGTPQYIAPEQHADGSKVDVRADQYSLAILLYEMLTRRVPQGAYRPIVKSCRQMTPEGEEVIMRAMSYKAIDRYESVRQFMRALRKALSHTLDSSDPENSIRETVAATCASANRDSPFPAEEFQIRLAADDERTPPPTDDEDSGEMMRHLSPDFALSTNSESDSPPEQAAVSIPSSPAQVPAPMPTSRLRAPGGSRWIALAILGVIVVVGMLVLFARTLLTTGAQ